MFGKIILLKFKFEKEKYFEVLFLKSSTQCSSSRPFSQNSFVYYMNYNLQLLTFPLSTLGVFMQVRRLVYLIYRKFLLKGNEYEQKYWERKIKKNWIKKDCKGTARKCAINQAKSYLFFSNVKLVLLFLPSSERKYHTKNSFLSFEGRRLPQRAKGKFLVFSFARQF